MSTNNGEFDTSIATDAPTRTSASASPVSVLTPVFGEAATASWPCSPGFVTTFGPIRPEPPMTTIFMGIPLCPAGASDAVRSPPETGQPTAL